MQRSSFDFDVITGPVPPRPAPKPAPSQPVQTAPPPPESGKAQPIGPGDGGAAMVPRAE